MRRFQAYAGPGGRRRRRAADAAGAARRRSRARRSGWCTRCAARIGDRFGPRGNRFHTGLDFPAPTGTLVTAAGRGQVVFAGWDAGGYGNLVVIEHPRGVRSMYAHLSRIGVGDGRVGGRGNADRPRRRHRASRPGRICTSSCASRGAAIDPLTALR